MSTTTAPYDTIAEHAALATVEYLNVPHIDHSRIPAEHLAIAMRNAALDPDGQVFPWRPMYPLTGSTVYWGGKLWTVGRKERGREDSCSCVEIVGQGHDDINTVCRGELRPITWTPHNEEWLGRE